METLLSDVRQVGDIVIHAIPGRRLVGTELSRVCERIAQSVVVMVITATPQIADIRDDRVIAVLVVHFDALLKTDDLSAWRG